MDANLDKIFIFFLLVWIGVVAIRRVVVAITEGKPRKQRDDKLRGQIQLFSASNDGDRSGKLLVHLMKGGSFQSLRTANHGNDFPDKRQYKTFIRYATPQIAESIKNINTTNNCIELNNFEEGDTYEPNVS